jgi:hypothetical protein
MQPGNFRKKGIAGGIGDMKKTVCRVCLEEYVGNDILQSPDLGNIVLERPICPNCWDLLSPALLAVIISFINGVPCLPAIIAVVRKQKEAAMC